MKLPIIITKEGCSHCHELKDWLDKKEIKYVEKNIEDKELVDQLIYDPNFLSTFCDKDQCVVNTPVVIYKGKYWFKELWGISGLREKEAKKLFDIK
ncbi:MAG: glutaredoxin domain-containing protein [Promethearchaeota archaeon]